MKKERMEEIKKELDEADFTKRYGNGFAGIAGCVTFEGGGMQQFCVSGLYFNLKLIENRK